MKNVIVTGATGFVGTHLTETLEHRFGPDIKIHALGSKTVDLTDQAQTFAWFADSQKNFRCDFIFHLAALYKPGDWSVRFPATQFSVNMSMNLNVLEAWKRFQPGAKMTSVLSSAIYPDHDAPHPEDEVYGSEPEEHMFAYAFSKKALLIGQKAHAIESGLKSVSLVLPTVYGPGDGFGDNAHVVGALIHRFAKAAREGRPVVEVWGSGKQKREFLFIDDAVGGIIAAALGSTSPMLNLGSGRADSIRELSEIIAGAVGFDGEIRNNPQKFEGVAKRQMDISRIKAELGWKPETSTTEGIRKTVDWFKAHWSW